MKRLKKGWKLPPNPKGFEIPAVFFYGKNIELDFINGHHRAFCEKIEYPFEKEVRAKKEDFEKIGFKVY